MLLYITLTTFFTKNHTKIQINEVTYTDFQAVQTNENFVIHK
jgi:hypothetical protein